LRQLSRALAILIALNLIAVAKITLFLGTAKRFQTFLKKEGLNEE